ncbi:hypothetical protein NE237_004819 [Protea cynaroides]|uniref:Uncharacterized protein n=1 Tax=Protea cynaroides TaxID=273540 RepID=A0A9Q0KJP5_9MAGN|nr:hypothetical protein NE237_004819 [Protea cynaroides]
MVDGEVLRMMDCNCEILEAFGYFFFKLIVWRCHLQSQLQTASCLLPLIYRFSMNRSWAANKEGKCRFPNIMFRQLKKFSISKDNPDDLIPEAMRKLDKLDPESLSAGEGLWMSMIVS